MCIRVEFHQQKNGLSALAWRSMKSIAPAVISSSMVSMRFLVKRPVSSIFCVPSGFAQQCSTPRGPNFFLNSGIPCLRIVLAFRLFLGVQVIEVAEELVEAMDGGQELVAIAKMVLAELAAGVALRLEQFGDGRVFRLQAEFRAGQADLGQSRCGSATGR